LCTHEEDYYAITNHNNEHDNKHSVVAPRRASLLDLEDDEDDDDDDDDEDDEEEEKEKDATDGDDQDE
jgi:hypothetical protein